MKTIKKIHYILLLLIIVFAVSSCKDKKSEAIKVALFKAPASEALIEQIPKFEKETDLKVKYEILPYSDLKSKLEQQFLTKSGDYDVIMADCIWIPSFADRDYLGVLDTTAYEKNYDFNDILPKLKDYLGRYPHNGSLYGMPFMSNTHMLTIRKNIVKPVADSLGYELPGKTMESAWTWSEYMEISKAITQKYEQENVYGTSLQARSGAWIIYEWYSELFGFVENEKARINGLPEFNENTKQAIQYYADLYQNAAPKAALTWGHEEETSAICSGKCAMDATSNVELAASFFDRDCNAQELKFAFPPIGKSGQASPDMGGYGLLLNKFSDDKENASKFIMWAASKEIHTKVVLNGGTPIRYSEIRNEKVLEKYPYFEFYDKLIANSVYRARIPKWPELQDVLSRELVSVMKEEKSAGEANQAIKNWINNNIAQQ
ncbi:MAG: extracellular solute-binding protein [Bacteroidales bacterium]|nr:extracellular solute-binding protein [Bacteroidales bacterium]